MSSFLLYGQQSGGRTTGLQGMKFLVSARIREEPIAQRPEDELAPACPSVEIPFAVG